MGRFSFSITGLVRRHGKVLLSFGAMQAMQIILPLLALPWLGRMLGTESFGLLMYMCLFPPLIALFVDWGIALGGSRRAALARGRRLALRRLLGAAITGKLCLAFVCVLFCCCLGFCLRYGQPMDFTLAVWAGLARGFNPAWFYQGAGYGIARMAFFEVSASLSALIGVIFLVRQPDDWPIYLFLLAFTKTLAYCWLYVELWRKYRFKLNFNGAQVLLRHTFALSAASFLQLFCYNGSQLVLSWFLSAAELGILVAVAKMLRALVSLVNPFTQTIFPEICILISQEPLKARKALKISLILTALCSIAAAGSVILLAPWLIAIALGPEYQSAIHILQIMILAAPLMAVNQVLAQQILVPYAEEKLQCLVLGIAAVMAGLMAAILGMNFGLIGGAILPICLELCILAGYAVAVYQTAQPRSKDSKKNDGIHRHFS